MICPETANQLADVMEGIEIVWSTLEAVHDALLVPDNSAETYFSAIRGAADDAFRIKTIITQIVTDINLTCCANTC